MSNKNTPALIDPGKTAARAAAYATVQAVKVITGPLKFGVATVTSTKNWKAAIKMFSGIGEGEK